MKILLVFALAAVSVCCGLENGDGGRRTKATAFRTQGLDDNGAPKWAMEGEYADFKGSIVDMQEATAHIINLRKCSAVIFASNGHRFALSSPSCQVMLALKELKSDSAIEFFSEGVSGSGIGYDIDLERRTVRLRTTVRFTIKQKIGKELIGKVQ